MFFMMGITPGKKQFEQLVRIICPNCGNAGRAVVYMTYSCLSLFFIPVFKWDKQYFVEMDCCGSVYKLNEEKGKAVSRGVDVIITSADLTPINYGSGYIRRCPNCSQELESSFDYCPRCGKKL